MYNVKHISPAKTHKFSIFVRIFFGKSECQLQGAYNKFMAVKRKRFAEG